MRRMIALMLAATLILAGCGVSQGEVDAIIAERDALGSAVEKAEAELSALADSYEQLEAKVDGWEDRAESAEAIVETAERERDTALADAEEAAGKLASILLAYSDDIGAARVKLAGAATAFACVWGTAQASDGGASPTAGETILKAFAQSDAFEALIEAPEIATAVSLAEMLGEDPYGADPEEIKAAAVNCWQKEDIKLNAALYDHQSVVREAVLEAACTLGASQIYGSFFPGYEYTGAYQNWQLTIGSEEANGYMRSVEDRFGSTEAFVAIPDAEIQAESDRCQDSRAIIEPKSNGTWNVGSEIKPGTWNAYDVTDCYWALLQENGDIRGSHYGDGLRLSVNVLASDGQFEISGCTFYYANP